MRCTGSVSAGLSVSFGTLTLAVSCGSKWRRVNVRKIVRYSVGPRTRRRSASSAVRDGSTPRCRFRRQSRATALAAHVSTDSTLASMPGFHCRKCPRFTPDPRPYARLCTAPSPPWASADGSAQAADPRGEPGRTRVGRADPLSTPWPRPIGGRSGSDPR